MSRFNFPLTAIYQSTKLMVERCLAASPVFFALAVTAATVMPVARSTAQQCTIHNYVHKDSCFQDYKYASSFFGYYFYIYNLPQRTPQSYSSAVGTVESTRRSIIRVGYQTLLQRVPSEAEIQFQLSAFGWSGNEVNDRLWFFWGLAHSPEFNRVWFDQRNPYDPQTISTEDYIRFVFRLVLDREPGPSEVMYWSSYANQAGRPLALIYILVSGESSIRNGGYAGQLDALWRGEAAFKFVNATEPPGLVDIYRNDPERNGGQIIAADGIWYLYERGSRWNAYPAAGVRDNLTVAKEAKCLATYRITVRTSKDRGQTWTVPVAIAVPTGKGEDDNGCAVTDGSVAYDAEQKKWHLLAQCIGEEKKWRMCHYSHSSDKMPFYKLLETTNLSQYEPAHDGAFIWQKDPGYALINGDIMKGQLDYPGSPGQEGTPEIMPKHNGSFRVTIHGVTDGYTDVIRALMTSSTLERGTFRAKPLSYAERPNFPGTILNKQNCLAADGVAPCAGIGHASILRDGIYYYQLAEGPSEFLDATSSTRDYEAPFILYRSPRIGRPESWERFWGPPILSFWQKAGSQTTKISYARLFQDQDKIYLYFWRYSAPPKMFLYELVPNSGISVGSLYGSTMPSNIPGF